ncbi:N-acetyltransferase [Aeromonas sp. FDAARGOS 1419]|uniref:GNAT family N-acetyltransferase n=1 Tax=Aeromonas sp. FDAARGOS 1419 TaxID=2778068 RepID=UPI001C22D254|nr:GNAT family N-acetyltransferase [Aeromonas sp. FDAARGOS 1419]QWZ78510.1 GNAT family N-acetyltransferase [Aeromonas sp. FDAARGOS 1419]
MGIELVDVPQSEFEQVFTAVKQGIFPYVESLFGWDDLFQRDRLTSSYRPQWFSWILHGGERIGLLCSKPYEDAQHVHLLIIFPQYQGRQLGAAVMERLHQEAEREGKCRVTLSSFTENHGAIRFYERLGYNVVEEDQAFVSMSRPLGCDLGSKHSG